MATRPRAGSSAGAPIPFLSESGLKSNSGLSLLPNHNSNTPFYVNTSVNLRIASLVVQEEAHFFVSIQLRTPDEQVLESKTRSRTEVSQGLRKSIQFQNNTFFFDTRALPGSKNAGPLHRSNATLSPGIHVSDPLHGLDIVVRVFQVFSREDGGQGFTKLVADGRLALSAVVSQPGFQYKEESDSISHSGALDSSAPRIVRQGSTLGSHTSESANDEDSGFPISIPLSDVREEEEDSPVTSTDGALTNRNSMEELEEGNFGKLNAFIELRKVNVKDLRRPKKPRTGADSVRESLVGNLVSQNGVSKYWNPSEAQAQDYSLRCYGVYNLETPTRTFLTLKTTEEAKNGSRARTGTPTSPETCNYIWSDALVLNLTRGETTKVGLFLSLVDYLKKTFIAKCIIPVEAVLPGEQYNFAIVVNGEGACIYISLSLEPNLLFQSNLFSKHQELCCLEVLLHGVHRIRPPSDELPDPFPSTSYIAVLHFESDFKKYLTSIANESPKLPFAHVRLDDRSAFDNMTPSAYRVSPPSLPSLYPQWNCLFEMTQTITDVFAPNAVLVAEIFEINVPRSGMGSIDFIAWSAIPLTELAKSGIRDGSIVRHSSILHMNAPYMGVNEEACEIHSNCAPHEFSILIEMRRWSSRFYLRHKQKGTPSSDVPGIAFPTDSVGGLRYMPPPIPHPHMSSIHNPNSSSSSLNTIDARAAHIGTHQHQHQHQHLPTPQELLMMGYPPVYTPTRPPYPPDYYTHPGEEELDEEESISYDEEAAGIYSGRTHSSSQEESLEGTESESDHFQPLETISESTEPNHEETLTTRSRKSHGHGSALSFEVESTTSTNTTTNHTATSVPSHAFEEDSLALRARALSDTPQKPSRSSLQDEPVASSASNPLRVAIPSSQIVAGPFSAGATPASAIAQQFNLPGRAKPGKPPTGLGVKIPPAMSAQGSAPSPPFHIDTPSTPGGQTAATATSTPTRPKRAPLTSNLKLSQRVERKLPDTASAEAEKNRRLLEIRIAELDLDNVPDSPEKRVLTIILPQVRQMVTRSATTLAKVSLAEQKIGSLQAENLALKKQVQRLLAARGEEISVPEISPSSSLISVQFTAVPAPGTPPVPTKSSSTSLTQTIPQRPAVPPKPTNLVERRSVPIQDTPSPTSSTTAFHQSGSSEETCPLNAVSAPNRVEELSLDHTITTSADTPPRSSSLALFLSSVPSTPGNSSAPQSRLSMASASGGLSTTDYSQLMSEIQKLIDESEKSASELQKTAELVAMRVGEDFLTSFASGVERLKSETAPRVVSSLAPAASPESIPTSEAESAASINASLRAEIDKMKTEMEQQQRKYLLTSAAFGEEVLLLRAKLKERKHQLQEARKYHAAMASSAQSQRHYIALSPLSVPPQPWLNMSQGHIPNTGGGGGPNAYPISPRVGGLPSPGSQGSMIPMKDEVNGSAATVGSLSNSSVRFKSPRTEPIHPPPFSFTTPLQSPQLSQVPPPFEAPQQSTGSTKLPTRS